VGLPEDKVVRSAGANNLLKGPEKQIPRRQSPLRDDKRIGVALTLAKSQL
jgi:hypothetical protein